MPAVPDWSEPMTLTSPVGTLLLNTPVPNLGVFLLDGNGCKFNIGVRSTKDHIPQADGDILHHRFLGGTEMPLKIQLWESIEQQRVACDALLELMLDTLTRHLRALLNAGDNEGRLSWSIPSGGPIRMLDDIRLLIYPDYTQDPSASGSTVLATIDSKYPYAQDLNQTRTGIADGATVTVTNTGSADYLPVFQVNRLNGVTAGSPVTDFTVENLTTGIEFSWDDDLPGANTIPGGHYGEIVCFDNTFYLDGDSTNESPGIIQLSSDYFPLAVGANDIRITGAPTDILWAPAFG